MKTIASIILFVLTISLSFAQKDTLGKSKYKCRVYFVNIPYPTEGELFSTTDSTIIVKSKNIPSSGKSSAKCILDTFPVSDIVKIEIRKKAVSFKSILEWLTIGATAGAIAGYKHGTESVEESSDTSYTSSDLKNSVLWGSAIGSTAGVFMAVTSDGKTKIIPMNGEIENYAKNRDELISYSIKK